MSCARLLPPERAAACGAFRPRAAWPRTASRPPHRVPAALGNRAAMAGARPLAGCGGCPGLPSRGRLCWRRLPRSCGTASAACPAPPPPQHCSVTGEGSFCRCPWDTRGALQHRGGVLRPEVTRAKGQRCEATLRRVLCSGSAAVRVSPANSSRSPCIHHSPRRGINLPVYDKNWTMPKKLKHGH